jgi:hypothetical protein
MDSDIKEQLAALEHAICAKLRPTFLIITDPTLNQDGDIYIIISTIAFKNMSVAQRVKSVFSLISKYTPDILEDRLIIIQTYSSSEIEDVIEDAFDEGNN